MQMYSIHPHNKYTHTHTQQNIHTYICMHTHVPAHARVYLYIILIYGVSTINIKICKQKGKTLILNNYKNLHSVKNICLFKKEH